MKIRQLICNKIKKAIEEYDFDYYIEREIENIDFSEKIDEKLNEINFEEIVQEIIDEAFEYEFDTEEIQSIIKEKIQ